MLSQSSFFVIFNQHAKILANSEPVQPTEPANNIMHHSIFLFTNIVTLQAARKVPSHSPGQVVFPSVQVTLHSHLPSGQGLRQVICQVNT